MDAKPLRADARRNREKILRAAEEVFTSRGASASTEDVAALAGVGIATVFRHFPTKEDLLRAIVVAGVEEMAENTRALIAEGDPATAFYTFFAGMVERAAGKKSIVDLLGQAGAELRAAKPVHAWRAAIEELLAEAKKAGTVRADADPDAVLALLLSTCQSAVSAGWPPGLQREVLEIVFGGLRPRG